MTAALTFFGLGHIEGLGIGTIAAAFTMGKAVGICGNFIDRHFRFETFLSRRKVTAE